ncbi:hypothetical protein QNH98_13405 [Myroides sp. mNGS23_01]|nr:hypothetical protein [Myroides sp. mNGS23_01]WHT38074.1 hypothetical protein QNH98_13405 [Myroides sp. mNGS23_01]
MKKLLLLALLFLSIGLYSFSDALNLNHLEGCMDDGDTSAMDTDAPTCQGGARTCCVAVSQKHS